MPECNSVLAKYIWPYAGPGTPSLDHEDQRPLQEAPVNPDDLVNLQVHNRAPADTLKLDQSWSVLEAEHVIMLPPPPHDFSLHSTRYYSDGETTADELPRSTLRDGRGKLIFPAGFLLRQLYPVGFDQEPWSRSRLSAIAVSLVVIQEHECKSGLS
jgi:hypothetical protein